MKIGYGITIEEAIWGGAFIVLIVTSPIWLIFIYEFWKVWKNERVQKRSV